MVHVLRRSFLLILLAALAVAVAAAPVASKGTGSLALNAPLQMVSLATFSCPPDAPPEANFCPTRTGSGDIRGLGRVAEGYTFFVVESDPCGGDRLLETTVKLEVADKGTLTAALPRLPDCLPSVLSATRAFTITSGTGIYAGATGAGTVMHQASYTPSGAAGTDTWTGSLTVPGLEFDLTPPALTGAVNKSVRARKGAKRARVTFKLTANDQVDGARPVTCNPKSGSKFRIGRTTVKCSATDTSANAVTGSFRVVVKRRR